MGWCAPQKAVSNRAWRSPVRCAALMSRADVKARDDFASLPAECQRGLSSAGSMCWILTQVCAGGWDRDIHRDGGDKGCGILQQQGCTSDGLWSEQSQPAVVALVPSSPVQDGLFFGGRDLQMSTASQARGGTRGTLAWGVSQGGNRIGVNLGSQTFLYPGGLIPKVAWPESQSPVCCCARVGEWWPWVLQDAVGAQDLWWGCSCPGHKPQFKSQASAELQARAWICGHQSRAGRGAREW